MYEKKAFLDIVDFQLILLLHTSLNVLFKNFDIFRLLAFSFYMNLSETYFIINM